MYGKVFLFGLATVAAASTTVWAQEPTARDRGRAVTQSLNTGPADSTMGSAPPTLPNTRPVSPRVEPGRQAAPQDDDPVARLLANVEAGAAPSTDRAARTEVAAVVETGEASSVLPPLIEGYYVRGDKNCNQVWPGDGDIAYLSRVEFRIDFGGCEDGVLTQIDDRRWTERQRCRTELGSEGPPNIIDYEVTPEGGLITRTRLGENALGREDRWTVCDINEVPEEARFHSEAS